MANQAKKTQFPENWDTVNYELPAHEVAAICRGSVPTVWRWAKNGVIPQPRKFGGATRWNSLELKAALDAAGGVTDQARANASTRAKSRGAA